MIQERRDALNYVVGVDVGTHSVGIAAVEIDDQGCPIRVINAVSFIHDSGVLEAKTKETRLAASGVARRTRRLLRRRRRRLSALDKQLAEWGWCESQSDSDPYKAWRARSLLATTKIDDPDQRGALLATAVRHIARHRGWRNPYSTVERLLVPTESSDLFLGVRERCESQTGTPNRDDVTVAQLAVQVIDYARDYPLRMGKTSAGYVKASSLLGGKLMQSDNANELHRIADVQGLSPQIRETLIRLVFAAESPRGSWVNRIGGDPFEPSQPRAAKASVAFQHFRIAQHLANVRVKTDSGMRVLSVDERRLAMDFLLGQEAGGTPTWSGVAEKLGLSRRDLAGGAAVTESGEERLPLRPPVDTTDQQIRGLGRNLRAIKEFWRSASAPERDALVTLLVDGKPRSRDDVVEWEDRAPENLSAWELVDGLDAEALAALDSIHLPPGRAAYSVESMRRLTAQMLDREMDLHAARMAIFGVPDDWAPPAEPIAAPTGNPAVDRVTRIVGRWLEMAVAEWGTPKRITVEHVRAAFKSAESVMRADRENRRRFEGKLAQRESVGRSVGKQSVNDADVRRFEAVQRQNGQCAYCGETITLQLSELDHIVPRKGVGSTNVRSNLVAACIPCNRSKSNVPFGIWAANSEREGVTLGDAVNRLRHWKRDNGVSTRDWGRFIKEVRERFECAEADPEIDARSLESVAWMATELRSRLDGRFSGAGVQIAVFRGAIIAEARRCSGLEGRIPWAGGSRAKDRFDRRHHAVDAAVAAMMNPNVALTLAERISLRDEQRLTSAPETWKEFAGSTGATQRAFARWKEAMVILAKLLARAFELDEVVVTTRTRLRLGNGSAHDATVHPFVHRPLGAALTSAQIDAAATPALWTALTREPDFAELTGLPASRDREIRVNGRRYDADDEIPLFDKPRAAIAVRGGWAQLGDSIHHARIFRIDTGKKTVYGMLRVFRSDLGRFRHEDLFQAELPASSVSMRTADPVVRRAAPGSFTYLGWLVPGDELLVDMEQLLVGKVGEASRLLGLGSTQRWRLVGFDDPSKLTLVSAYLAAEGLDRLFGARPDLRDHRNALDAVLHRWRPAVNVLFGKGKPTIIRRDSIGRPRWQSRSNLPISWRPGS